VRVENSLIIFSNRDLLKMYERSSLKNCEEQKKQASYIKLKATLKVPLHFVNKTRLRLQHFFISNITEHLQSSAGDVC